MSLPTRAPLMVSGRRCLTALSLLALHLLSPSQVAADPVIEAYSGERPADADEVLASLRAALENEGHVVAPKLVAEALAQVMPRSGVRDPKLSVEAIAAQIDVGVKSYLRGDYQVAAGQLREAIAAAHANPALVVSDDKAPQWMTRGLAALAISRARTRDFKGAAEAMSEQLRSFPSTPITIEEFGSEGSELYGSTRRALESAPRAGLTVNAGDPNARIFVNELGHGRGSVALRDLTPGSYRVLVQGSSAARLYTVEVDGAAVELSLDWAADSSFTATPQWIGFALPPTVEDRGDRSAARMAARLDSGLIVVGVAEGPGGRMVVAAAFEEITGDVIGRAEMKVGNGKPWSARQVKDFLRALRGEPSPAAPAGPPDLSKPAPAAFKPARWPVYLFAGLALASGAVAVVARDDEDLFPAAIVGAAGFGLTAFGVFLDVRARERRATLSLSPTATGGMASVGWSY